MILKRSWGLAHIKKNSAHILQVVEFRLVAFALSVQVLDDRLLAAQLVPQRRDRLLQDGDVALESIGNHLKWIIHRISHN